MRLYFYFFPCSTSLCPPSAAGSGSVQRGGVSGPVPLSLPALHLQPARPDRQAVVDSPGDRLPPSPPTTPRQPPQHHQVGGVWGHVTSCDFFNPFYTSEVIPALLGGGKTPPRAFPLFTYGKRNAENCKKVPLTCTLLDRLLEATSCRHGETKFLVVPPKSHIPPHTGQTNTRLVVVMGLNLGEGELEIRLGEEKRSGHL